MPIPILKMKGLRRTGPQIDSSRLNPDGNAQRYNAAAAAMPSQRLNPRNTVGIPVAPSSRVSSPSQGVKDSGRLAGRGISAFSGTTNKQTRNISSGNVKTVTPRHAYRPQNATSSTTISTPRINNANDRAKKSGLPKPSDVSNNNFCNSVSYNTNVNTNSNRSSLISNCSSIPAPSSSSSNRNSSSSISSNFSVSSWNSNYGGVLEQKEPKSYPGASGGSDTFPRTSSLRRTKQQNSAMTKSLEGEVDNRNYLNKTANKQRLREPQKKYPTTAVQQLSSSESALLPRTAQSNSNLNTLSIDRHQNSRSIPKPTATVRGKCKGLAPTGHNMEFKTPGSDRRLRPLNLNSSRRVQGQKSKENVALVSPFTPKARKTNVNESKDDDKLKKMEDGKPTLAAEEDDGYSSVVNTDQHDEDEDMLIKSAKCKAEDVELLNIQPMKLLDTGISSYSLLPRDSNPRRSYPYCTASADDNVRNSVPVEIHSSKWEFGQLTKTNENSSKKPDSIFSTKNENKHTDSSLTNTSNSRLHEQSPQCDISEIGEKESNRPITAKTRIQSAPRQTTYQDLPSITPKPCAKNQTNSVDTRCCKTLDHLQSPAAYKAFMNTEGTTRMISGNDNWLTRNTIATMLPVTPNRKFTIVGDPLVSSLPKNERQNPSLPSLMEINDKYSEPRPVSMDSSRLPETPTASPFFYRSNSLRSHTKFATQPSFSLDEVPSQLSYKTNFLAQNFVRGSPKYSTVIPCTNEEDTFPAGYPFNLNDTVVEEKSAVSSFLGSGQYIEDSNTLRNLLVQAHQKIASLVEQLSSSKKLVTAYEHSLTNMTHRLQQLTLLTEKKETEVTELRKLLERSCLDTSVDCKSATLNARLNRGGSVESLSSLASNMSVGSEISSSSMLSNTTFSSYNSGFSKEKSAKKRNWFRSSFSKAFKRREKRKEDDVFSQELNERKQDKVNESLLISSVTGAESNRGYCSLPSSPLPQRFQHRLSDAFSEGDPEYQTPNQDISSLLNEISCLKKTLLDKDSALTESHLENLSSTHKIESLEETVQKLTNNVSSLSNRRINDTSSPSDRPSFLEVRSSENLAEAVMNASPIRSPQEGKVVKVIIYRPDVNRDETTYKALFSKTISIESKTSWAQLDAAVCQAFDEHLKFLDQDLNLSLNSESILHYELGEVTRTLNFEPPELLPYGYLVGEVDSIILTLRNASYSSVDFLAFETLIPKPHLHRYFTLLKEHRRVILEGPEGSGKSYLALRLAEFVVMRLGIEPSSGNIAIFKVNEDTRQDLSAYLSHLSHLCESKSSDLPLVIILDSLERVQKLHEVLSTSLRVPHDQCPFIIGTCRFSRSRKSELLKLQNNFRWISLNPNFEPIRELLNRSCRRHSALSRHSSRRSKKAMESLLEWLPRCLDKVNSVLSSSSSVGSIGPGVLLPFPDDLREAEVWFYDVWKKRLLPHLQKAAEEAHFMPNDLTSWQELDKCLREELPWSFSKDLTAVALPRMPSADLLQD